jgi:hypothetical protein
MLLDKIQVVNRVATHAKNMKRKAFVESEAFYAAQAEGFDFRWEIP